MGGGFLLRMGREGVVMRAVAQEGDGEMVAMMVLC